MKPKRTATIAAVSSLALLLVACSAKPSAGHGGAADTSGGTSSSSNCQSPQTIQTGTGNNFTAQLCVGAEVTTGDTYSYPYTVTITYVDLIQPPYFGAGKQTVHAWIQADLVTAYHSGDPSTTSNQQQTFDLTLPPDSDTTGTFAGSVTYSLGGYFSDTETQLSAIDVAFFDDSGDWDSNYGANYHVSFD